MKIKPEALTSQGYILYEKLGHMDLVPFIRTYLKKNTKYKLLYYLCNIGNLALVIYYFVHNIQIHQLRFITCLNHFSYGIGLALALVPLHEYLHVIAYKSQGAVHTSYDVNIRKFYFMALADKFVANKKEFEIVALTPFITITVLLLITLLLISVKWQLTVVGTLLAHTAMCSGDFGMLSYFEWNKTKQMVTYDDVNEKISYFYIREK